jgi:oligosaccharide reducing-end xylanase
MEKIGDDHCVDLVAMNAVASLASTNANRKDFVEDLWNTPVPTGTYRYYDGLLYMIGLLHVGGNFRIYIPPGTPAMECPGGIHQEL